MKNSVGENNSQNKNASNYQSRNKYSANFVGASKNDIKSQQKVYELNTKNTSQSQTKKTSVKEKLENLTNVLKIFVIMVSATAVVGGVGVFDYFFTPTSSIKLVEFDLYTSESSVSYFGALENYEGQEDVYVVLRNDFTNRTEKVEEQAFMGTFENLQTNMQYTFEIKYGDVVIITKTIRTVAQKYDQTGGPTNG